METAVVVTGHAAERIEERRGELEERHGVAVETVFNPKAVEWNNCYSLWCAREHFAHGVLLCNGDTVHPPEIEQRLLAARGHSDLVLALDDVKALGDEEMKVLLNADGLLRGINKAHDPAEAAGEYVGLTLIEPEASEGLAEALEATWRRDPSLYYEDGFQEYAERGGRVGVASVGGLEWVEVDDQRDLDRARELAWRC
jgi:choline kinase